MVKVNMSMQMVLNTLVNGITIEFMEREQVGIQMEISKH